VAGAGGWRCGITAGAFRGPDAGAALADRGFGADGEHELALRLQHFSNGGIRRPNPGETFLQLRYAWRY
jgi:Lipid A 3-O-deacylase (PagL)